MATSVFTSLGRLLSLVAQIVITAAFGILAWAFWGLYHEEQSSLRFENEGQLVMVQVHEVNTAKQIWTDYLGNIKNCVSYS